MKVHTLSYLDVRMSRALRDSGITLADAEFNGRTKPSIVYHIILGDEQSIEDLSTNELNMKLLLNCFN